MDIVSLGLIVSGSLIIFLVILFSFESRRGSRIGEGVRAHADFFVLKLGHRLNQFGVLISRDFLRQVVHYFFHTILRFLIGRVRKMEERLRRVMHVNKTLAKNAEREGMVRSKLEEVALHKVASALSDEEKKRVREHTLSGGL